MYIANTISYDIHWQSLQFLQAHDLCRECSQKNALPGQYEQEPSLSNEEWTAAASPGAQGSTRKETELRKIQSWRAKKDKKKKKKKKTWQTHRDFNGYLTDGVWGCVCMCVCVGWGGVDIDLSLWGL